MHHEQGHEVLYMDMDIKMQQIVTCSMDREMQHGHGHAAWTLYAA